MKNPFIHEAHRVERFQDQSVVDRYHLRPTYSPETFTILNELIVDEPRVSSGGVVSLDAAAVTPGITKVGVYEPALIVDDSRQPVPADYTEHLTTLAAEGKRDEAVEYFLTQAVGIPAEYIGGMKQDQATWSGMTGVAHSIAYDAAFVSNVMQGKPLPTYRWVKVTLPVLVADGGASDAWVHHATDALAKVLPHASRQTLEGQTHMVDPKVLAPVIIEFFKK